MTLADLLSEYSVVAVLPFFAIVIWQIRGIVDEQKRQGEIQKQILEQAKLTNGRVTKNEKDILVIQERTKKAT